MTVQQYIQLFFNFYEIIRRSKLVHCITDVHEIQERINDVLKSLFMECKEERGPLVSIIIPTRNEAHKLPKLLYSLRNQCYRNIEVVVADYMSIDDTPKIAKIFGAKVLNIDKPGVGYATHVAVNECRGEILIRTDADTIFPKDIISLITKVLLRRKDKLVAHVGHVYYDGNFIENAMAYYYDKYLRNPWNTTGHFIAFKHDLIEKGFNFDPKLRYDDDWDFGHRVYKSLGPHVFYYNYYKSVLVSARRIHATGLTRYIFGFRKR